MVHELICNVNLRIKNSKTFGLVQAGYSFNIIRGYVVLIFVYNFFVGFIFLEVFRVNIYILGHGFMSTYYHFLSFC